MDETEKMMLKCYLRGIGDGVDMVFSSLRDVGCESFDLKDADRYRQLVRKAIIEKAVGDDLFNMRQ